MHIHTYMYTYVHTYMCTSSQQRARGMYVYAYIDMYIRACARKGIASQPTFIDTMRANVTRTKHSAMDHLSCDQHGQKCFSVKIVDSVYVVKCPAQASYQSTHILRIHAREYVSCVHIDTYPHMYVYIPMHMRTEYTLADAHADTCTYHVTFTSHYRGTKGPTSMRQRRSSAWQRRSSTRCSSAGCLTRTCCSSPGVLV